MVRWVLASRCLSGCIWSHFLCWSEPSSMLCYFPARFSAERSRWKERNGVLPHDNVRVGSISSQGGEIEALVLGTVASNPSWATSILRLDLVVNVAGDPTNGCNQNASAA